MFIDPAPTPYDLQFRLFGTRVRVHIFFWLFSAILGWNRINQENGFQLLLIWVLCTFVSILLHEFGHVWAGKAFGTNGQILLYSFGGLAIGASDLRLRWQRIAVYLAGPAIQLALYGAIYGWLRYMKPVWLIKYPMLGETIATLMVINWLWPLFNLLPVFPLDGGQVSREIFEQFSPRDGLKYSLIFSVTVAAVVAVNALVGANGRRLIPIDELPVGTWAAILFGMLAFSNYQLLQQVNSGPRWDDRTPWE